MSSESRTPITDNLRSCMEAFITKNEALELEVKRLKRAVCDREYMMQAYLNMLGPKGLEVAKGWQDRHVQRIHFDWQPGANAMSGEERAEFILEMEKAPSRRLTDEELRAM